MLCCCRLEDSRAQRILWLLEEVRLAPFPFVSASGSHCFFSRSSGSTMKVRGTRTFPRLRPGPPWPSPPAVKRYSRDPKTLLAPKELADVHPLGKVRSAKRLRSSLGTERCHSSPALLMAEVVQSLTICSLIVTSRHHRRGWQNFDAGRIRRHRRVHRRALRLEAQRSRLVLRHAGSRRLPLLAALGRRIRHAPPHVLHRVRSAPQARSVARQAALERRLVWRDGPIRPPTPQGELPLCRAVVGGQGVLCRRPVDRRGQCVLPSFLPCSRNPTVFLAQS